ncbi:hypothetical protein [Brachybacterium sp. UMB0905]|uniref:hypothetical protein n=1 Tax=Brachybacterium sp. UMB0905 TaxID=2069310 RepID=UPI0013044B49|nr:hypothetical protein [Brachybacterium sp. UMB0905]
MTLLVLGAPQALATAVLAAATTAEQVVVQAESAPAELPRRGLARKLLTVDQAAWA